MADEAKKAEAAGFKAKGNAALGAGNYEEAVDWYTKAIECDGNDKVFYSNRSAAYLSMGTPMGAAKALEDAERCCKVAPDWPKAFGRKGAALHKLGKLEDAVAAYDEGLKVDPGNDALKSARAAVEAEASRPPPGAGGANPLAAAFGEDMFAKIATHPKLRAYLADPGYVSALRMLQSNPQNLGAAGSDPRVMETIGFLLGIPMSMGGPGDDDAAGGPAGAAASAPSGAGASADAGTSGSGASSGGGGGGAKGAEDKKMEEPAEVPDEELSEEDRAKRAKKRKAVELKEEGNVAYKAKDFDAAMAKYDEAIAMDDEDITFLLNKASVHFAKGDFEACVSICRDAVERGRELMTDYSVIAKAFARMGNAEMKLKRYGEAVEAYESSLMEHHTDDVYTRAKKARAAKKKAEEEAYLDADKAVEAKERGNTAFKAGDFKEAIVEYTEAIKRDPKNAVYYCNRAAGLMKLMDFTPALADCNTALKIDPTYLKALSRKAGIQFFMKEYHKAMETYQQGLKLEPDNAECRDGLARTIQKINSEAGAAADPERQAKAMADPEIQSILQDPIVQQTLRDMQTIPGAATKAMQDPVMGAKIQKLIAAGVLQVK